MIDIPNYDNYKIDIELEQIYNSKFNRYLKNKLDKDGYYRVSLCKNGKEKKFYIHRLIYISINPTEDISLFEVDHIDNDRTNNKIENLRKATRSENMSNTKTYITNKLGIKYIIKFQNGYRFKLIKNKITYYKWFKTLEETIEYRNIKVKEINGEFTNLG